MHSFIACFCFHGPTQIVHARTKKKKRGGGGVKKHIVSLSYKLLDFSYTSTAKPISSVSSALSSERGKDIKVTGNKFKCIKEISQVYNCKEGFVHDKYFNIVNFLSHVPFQTSTD